MKTNKLTKTVKPVKFTHNGAVAARSTPEMELERSVLAAFLFENSFYEDGLSHVDRITSLVSRCSPKFVADLAVKARNQFKLRHMPLWLIRIMADLPKYKPFVKDALVDVIQRPDELSEFLALYWKDGKCPISNQVKKGLAEAFVKFDEYSLAKYNGEKDIMLRDVLFLTHAKPVDKKQEKVWKCLINNELKTPDTWEVEISASKNKKESWTRLLKEEKLGGLAFLRNLRNMQEASVDRDLITNYFQVANFDKVLPFRFVSAAQFAPHLESHLETAMFNALKSFVTLKGKTILMIDVSGSMSDKVSGKSELTRLDAACALAMLAREICEEVEVYTFSNTVRAVPNRRGFGLASAIKQQFGGGTLIGNAVKEMNQKEYDRLIVFTDEQSSDPVDNPKNRGYMVNVAAFENGVGYEKWLRINGFSEAIVSYIQQYELLTELAKVK